MPSESVSRDGSRYEPQSASSGAPLSAIANAAGAIVGTPGFEVLFHASPMGVGFSVDRELREVNDRLCEMTGYARHELIGQSLRMLHPSDTAFQAVGEAIYPQLAEQPVARVDAQLRRKDGQIRDVALCLALVYPNEPARGVIATVLDVTDYLRTQAELRAARARLETALAAGELGLYEGDMMTGDVEADARFLGQLGLPPDAPMSVARWLGLIHPDDRERLRGLAADTIAGRVSECDTEYRIRHAAGGWRWVLDRWQVYARDAQGAVQRVVGVHLDITERKVAEEALAELNRTLETRVAERTVEVNRQAAQLRALATQLTQTEQRERTRLATILHDHIQQLIVAAQIQVTQLAQAKSADALHAAVQGVGDILADALSASRSLTVELSPPVLQERGLISGLHWLAARMREQHGLTVRVHAEPDAEPSGEALRFLLFECARELLLNVVKHAGVDRAELTLGRVPAASIRLRVADAGRGFDPNSLHDPRLETMSFGLFSIRERLSHLGGWMHLDSAPARGTRATLSVPADEARTAMATTQADAPGGAARSALHRHQRRPCRVMLVDDHQIVREGLAGLLRDESDIEVIGEAANGTQAITLAATLQPDVIIMDINLGPGIDGIEATRRVLAMDPHIRVIGLSMHADQQVADAMRAAGAAAYVTKGGPPEDLIGAIRARYRA